MAGKISLTLNYDDDLDSVLSKRFPDWEDHRVLSKSLDARGANRGKGPKYHYSLHFIKKGEKFESSEESFPNLGAFKDPPLIIGAGPAGLAAGEQLRKLGYQIKIYDRYDRPGGLLIYGIPNFKLEKHVVQRRTNY